MSFSKGKAALLSTLGGAVVALALFGVETRALVGQGAIGLDSSMQGALSELFRAVKPMLPGLLARVAVAYAVAGAAVGLAAWALTQALPDRKWLRAAMVALEGLVLCTVWAWEKAIARPALFDDVPWLRGMLHALVDGGAPWHPRLVLGAWLAAHVALFAATLVRGPARGESALRPSLRWVAVAGGVALVPIVVRIRDAVSKREDAPLIVLVGIDAFRPDRLSAMGGRGDVAPNLEALAKEGTLFRNAYTPIGQTEPAWRSLLTAMWPHRTGVRYPLTAESRWTPAPTFASQLAEAGWQTAFFTDCSRFHYEPQASGFALREQPPRGALNFALEKLRYRALGVFADNALGAAWVPELIDNRALAGLHDPIGYAKRLASKTVALAKKGPTLVAYHATAAHFPGDPVYPFYRRYVPASAPLERRLRMFYSPIHAGVSKAPDASSREIAEALYDELLAQADAQLGILVDTLKSEGLYDKAWIVVFSDHGESFHADHPELAGSTPVHGARLSEEENRIVLVAKPPSGWGEIPRERSELVRLIDIGPTLLDVTAAPALSEVDGVSLVPLLRGESMPSLALYAETGFTHASPDAFDPEHASLAPRTLDAYRVRPDGVIEVSPEAHAAAIAEKDIGAFDGKRWVIRAPLKDGTSIERCEGDCPSPALVRWRDAVTSSRSPPGG
jgi:arylsulfatase A-like enzyme